MIRKITKDQPLKVMTFTDTHIDHVEERGEVCLKLMKAAVDEVKPDVIVFVGDNVVATDNEARTKKFVQFMTELQIPWAPVLGNHEGDSPDTISREYMTELLKSSPYCLIPEEPATLEDGTPVFGHTNYSVELKRDDDSTAFRLILMDGGSHIEESALEAVGLKKVYNTEYDWLKEDQIAWYKEQICDDNCPSMIFCHIPLPEFIVGYEEGTLLFGKKRERVCCASYNSGMFDAMVESGKTIAYVTGHDHVNDYRVLYKGIQLIYNRMGGMGSYNALTKKVHDSLLQGCFVYHIGYSGQMDVEDFLYKDRLPHLYDEMYSVVRKE